MDATKATYCVQLDAGRAIYYYPFGVALLKGFIKPCQMQQIYDDVGLGQEGGVYERKHCVEHEEHGHPDSVYNGIPGTMTQ